MCLLLQMLGKFQDLMGATSGVADMKNNRFVLEYLWEVCLFCELPSLTWWTP